MANYIALFSPTGGTRRVAEILAEELGRDWQEMDLCRETEAKQLQKEDLLLAAVPSYGGRVPAVAAGRLKNLTGNGATAILVCVYGNREWDDTLTELQDILEAQGFRCTAAVAAVAEHSIFRQFAAGRPDAADAAQLKAFARQIRSVREAGQLILPGSHGSYRDFGGTPFKPEGDERCTGCGICAANCPAGAIDPASPAKTNRDICISCMRCISLCSAGIRALDPGMMAASAEKMAPKLGGHKENHLFLVSRR